MITRSQFKVGEFLYGVPSSIESEKNNPPIKEYLSIMVINPEMVMVY